MLGGHIRNLAAVALLFALGSCTHSDSPPATTPPVVLPTGSYNFHLSVHNGRPLDSAVSRYVLWLEHRDSSWQAVPLSFWYVGHTPDTMGFQGVVKTSADSIMRVVLSVESSSSASKPTVSLLDGAFVAGTTNAATLSLSNSIADCSNAAGTVLFTTNSADTNRAKQEFYLMEVKNGVNISSITGLPVPRAGWVYGLWVLDSGFYPIHKFFYGYFTDVNGPGSIPSNSGFPFPGGFNPAPLNDAGAKLEVTLEPEFSVKSNHPAGPSPMVVLSAQLTRFINYNETKQFTNVWSSSAARGVLTLTK